MKEVYLSTSNRMDNTREIMRTLSAFDLTLVGASENINKTFMEYLPKSSAIILDSPTPKEIGRLEEEIFGAFPDNNFFVTRNHVVEEPVRSNRFPNVTVCSYEGLISSVKDDF